MKNNKKKIDLETKEIKETKPLGNPIPNRYLLMLVKNHIKNGDD